MSKRETYETRTEELITPILDRMNFELVDVEYVKEGGTWYLRAYIDKEGGITVNDCEAVAREMNEILDREDFVEDSYVFEVLPWLRSIIRVSGSISPHRRDKQRNQQQRTERH